MLLTKSCHLLIEKENNKNIPEMNRARSRPPLSYLVPLAAFSARFLLQVSLINLQKYNIRLHDHGFFLTAGGCRNINGCRMREERRDKKSLRHCCTQAELCFRAYSINPASSSSPSASLSSHTHLTLRRRLRSTDDTTTCIEARGCHATLKSLSLSLPPC